MYTRRHTINLYVKFTYIGEIPIRKNGQYRGKETIKTPITTSRSEPSSRIFLIGEQPNPWDLLQPQDKMSRHRGAELRRRYGLLGGTSLLSPE